MALILQHRGFVIFLSIYAAVLYAFPLKHQAVEAYGYAAAAEGYYNLNSTFLPNSRDLIPNISRYHPNHPLPHYISSLLYENFRTPAMTTLKALNAVAAILFLAAFYALLIQFFSAKAIALLAAMFAASMYAFWLTALSGETQMFALALMTAAVGLFFEFLRFGKALHLFLAAICYVFAGAFHLFSFVFIFPAVAALVSRRDFLRHWRMYTTATVIICLGYAFFYGVLLIGVLGVQNFDEYVKTLFIYRNILHKAYSSPEWWQLFSGALLKSFVSFDSGAGFLAQMIVALLVLIGFMRMIRSRLTRSLKIFLIAWPFIQVGLQLIVNGRPEGLNFWLFLFPVFFTMLAFALEGMAAYTKQIFPAFLILAFVAAINFISAILPNFSLERTNYTYFENLDLPKSIPLAIVVHEPVLTFVEIWAVGSLYGFKNQHVFLPCCGEKHYLDNLAEWAAKHENFLLITDSRSESLEKVVNGAKLLQERSGKISAISVPNSLYVKLPADHEYAKNLKTYLKLR